MRAIVRATAVLGVTVLGLTACGPLGQEAEATGPFAGLSGPQIANKAIAATKTASSLTLDVNLSASDGDADGRIRAYMSMDTKGRCAGTLTLGPTGTAEILKTDSKVAYMRFDEAFLREQNEGGSAEENAAVLKQLRGRWVATDVADPSNKDSLAFCELDAMLADFDTGLTSARRGEETTVGGRKALRLTESSGGTTTTMYVATEGKPYLLKIEQKGGEEPGTMSFSAYDKPVPAKKPAAKDILDPDQLGQHQSWQ
ncbi:hypothetical protein QWM81_03440 [Streptomyces ficellus]|uniref:Lipoprotein n=1 Tax=Streptomyces ficellus TaxID=1977088 RepID=A0ABT7Z0U6_9ACTN|nr:hypothetical protein [Streptomyces ficellus]MDN3293115.1 hypothetical protein [Streptomyces ficellus]